VSYEEQLRGLETVIKAGKVNITPSVNMADTVAMFD